MNSVTLDWLDLTVILSAFAACASMGLFAAWRMNRFEVVKPRDPVTPMAEAQQIEVTVVDRGLRRWRRTTRAAEDSFQSSSRKLLSLP